MYNDYYLEQINSKLATSNSYLDDIKDNQATIIEMQQEIISGDVEIKNEIQQAKNGIALIGIAIMLYIIYYFIMRCLK